MRIIDQADEITDRQASGILSQIKWSDFDASISLFKRTRSLFALDMCTDLSESDKVHAAKTDRLGVLRKSKLYEEISEKYNELLERERSKPSPQELLEDASDAAFRELKSQLHTSRSESHRFAAAKEIFDRVAPKPTRTPNERVSLHIPEHIIESIAKAHRIEEQKKLEAQQLIDVTPDKEEAGPVSKAEEAE